MLVKIILDNLNININNNVIGNNSNINVNDSVIEKYFFLKKKQYKQ